MDRHARTTQEAEGYSDAFLAQEWRRAKEHWVVVQAEERAGTVDASSDGFQHAADKYYGLQTVVRARGHDVVRFGRL